MKVLRKIIEIDEERCDGCGMCVPSCAEGALAIVDGKAKVISDKFCDGLGACLGECPNDALKIVEREADEFDEAAVEAHLEHQKSQTSETSLACGCPSTAIQQFSPLASCPCPETDAESDTPEPVPSALGNWPVQIRLVPPDAPFLQGADILVAADCVPFAFAGFHNSLLKGKRLLVGCPKLDNAQEYIDKFAQIFKQSDINSVTVAIMEVPCCGGLPVIVQKGMEKAGVHLPMEKIVISTQGKRLNR